jgi:hypothetical protein
VTAGLPVGLGGTYRGLEAMLRDCWGRVAQIFDARPEPEQFSMRVLMRVFLAEASGVIGGRLVPLLVAAGHEVAGMTRTPGKVDRLRALGVNASGGDVRSSTPPAPPSAPTDHQRSTALKLPVRTEDPSP